MARRNGNYLVSFHPRALMVWINDLMQATD